MAVRLGLMSCLVLVAAACGDGAGDTTTTSVVTTTTVVPPSTTTTVPATTVPAPTTTVEGVLFVPEFTIVERTDDDVLVVAVPPASYSDLQLQNLVGELVERFAPVTELHIVDDDTLAALVLADSVTDDEQALLDEHYFLRLEDGFRMVFLGPFSDVGEVILGS